MNFQPKPSSVSAAEVKTFLETQNAKDQLRFILCGSVDDGKSTLLGRLLFDSKSVFDDHLVAVEAESRKYGTQNDKVDLALLVDGLQAEREQGITIDVAYRFFETAKRKFIAADTPGHEQYTRNMATGASTAQAAVILVDAIKGISRQTRRHTAIVQMMGIDNIILAVNKVDLLDDVQGTFEAILKEYQQFAGKLGLTAITAIPVSALNGDNVYVKSTTLGWYNGPTLIEALEGVVVDPVEPFADEFIMPVQLVNRPSPDFRGYCGTIARGCVEKGQAVRSALSSAPSVVTRILGPDGPIDRAEVGQAITLEIDDALDISRGDALCAAEARIDVADQFAAHIIWMDEKPMLPNRRYYAAFATAGATARITDLTYQLNIETLDQRAAKQLDCNEIGYCKLSLDQAVPFTSYGQNKTCGSFILIDRTTNATVGAGMIDHALRRASNIAWHNMKVDKKARSRANNQKACIVWFTGLSGSGKSTIADRLEQKLFEQGHRTYLLDGDNVRHGLNRDIGFTDADRVENIRRVGEVAKLMVDAGLIVLASFISPFASERQMVRALVEEGEFVEVYVNAPLEICEERDPKGLYKKARAGQLKNFTGIDSDYQPPESAEIVLESAWQDPDVLAEQVLSYLQGME